MSNLTLNQVEILGDEGNRILFIEDFHLKSGTFVALKGISGAGKSTFLNTVSGILTPNSGQVLWGDTDIVLLSEAKKAQFRRDNMGLIFQHFPLFEELSLFENITIAAHYTPKHTAKIAANAKRLMAHFAFDDLKRESKNYSGGQKQRIAFMRALVGEPSIIIADEPTASLDRDNVEKMVDFLLAESGDKTLIVTSHDDYLLQKADRVLTIDGGRIVEDV